MTSFRKFASVAILVCALAPFAAQARSGDLGTTGPATPAAQSANHGAQVSGRGAENAQFASNNARTGRSSTVSPDSVGG